MNWGVGQLPGPNGSMKDGQRSRRRSPVQKILRSRSDAVEGKSHQNNCKRSANRGNPAPSENSPTHLNNKKKTVVKSDIYGNEYESSEPGPGDEGPNLEEEQLKKEGEFKYFSLRRRILSFPPSQQSGDLKCEDLFEIYCEALELQFHVEINTKKANRSTLTSYDIEVSHGSFYWEQFNGMYLVDADQAREYAFAVGCVAVINKFGYELLSQLGSNATRDSSFCHGSNPFVNALNDQENPRPIYSGSNPYTQNNYWFGGSDGFQKFYTNIPPPPPPPSPPPPAPATPLGATKIAEFVAPAISTCLPPHLISVLGRTPQFPPHSGTVQNPPLPPLSAVIGTPPQPLPPYLDMSRPPPVVNGIPFPAFSPSQKLLPAGTFISTINPSMPPLPPPPPPPPKLPYPDSSKKEPTSCSTFQILASEPERISNGINHKSCFASGQFPKNTSLRRSAVPSLDPRQNQSHCPSATWTPNNISDYKNELDTRSWVFSGRDSICGNFVKSSSQHKQSESKVQTSAKSEVMSNYSTILSESESPKLKRKRSYHSNLTAHYNMEYIRSASDGPAFPFSHAVPTYSHFPGNSRGTRVEAVNLAVEAVQPRRSYTSISETTTPALVNSKTTFTKSLDGIVNEINAEPRQGIFKSIVNKELPWFKSSSVFAEERVVKISVTHAETNSISVFTNSPKFPAGAGKPAVMKVIPHRSFTSICESKPSLVNLETTSTKSLNSVAKEINAELSGGVTKIVSKEISGFKSFPISIQEKVEKGQESKSVAPTHTNSLSLLANSTGTSIGAGNPSGQDVQPLRNFTSSNIPTKPALINSETTSTKSLNPIANEVNVEPCDGVLKMISKELPSFEYFSGSLEEKVEKTKEESKSGAHTDTNSLSMQTNSSRTSVGALSVDEVQPRIHFTLISVHTKPALVNSETACKNSLDGIVKELHTKSCGSILKSKLKILKSRDKEINMEPCDGSIRIVNEELPILKSSTPIEEKVETRKTESKSVIHIETNSLSFHANAERTPIGAVSSAVTEVQPRKSFTAIKDPTRTALFNSETTSTKNLDPIAKETNAEPCEGGIKIVSKELPSFKLFPISIQDKVEKRKEGSKSVAHTQTNSLSLLSNSTGTSIGATNPPGQEAQPQRSFTSSSVTTKPALVNPETTKDRIAKEINAETCDETFCLTVNKESPGFKSSGLLEEKVEKRKQESKSVAQAEATSLSLFSNSPNTRVIPGNPTVAVVQPYRSSALTSVPTKLALVQSETTCSKSLNDERQKINADPCDGIFISVDNKELSGFKSFLESVEEKVEKRDEESKSASHTETNSTPQNSPRIQIEAANPEAGEVEPNRSLTLINESSKPEALFNSEITGIKSLDRDAKEINPKSFDGIFSTVAKEELPSSKLFSVCTEEELDKRKEESKSVAPTEIDSFSGLANSPKISTGPENPAVEELQLRRSITSISVLTKPNLVNSGTACTNNLDGIVKKINTESCGAILKSKVIEQLPFPVVKSSSGSTEWKFEKRTQDSKSVAPGETDPMSLLSNSPMTRVIAGNPTLEEAKSRKSCTLISADTKPALINSKTTSTKTLHGFFNDINIESFNVVNKSKMLKQFSFPGFKSFSGPIEANVEKRKENSKSGVRTETNSVSPLKNCSLNRNLCQTIEEKVEIKNSTLGSSTFLVSPGFVSSVSVDGQTPSQLYEYDGEYWEQQVRRTNNFAMQSPSPNLNRSEPSPFFSYQLAPVRFINFEESS